MKNNDVMRGVKATVICLVLVALFILATVFMFSRPAKSHEWLTGTTDPVTGNACCGGSDCATIPARWLIQEGDGYRVRLTLAQTRHVNPQSSEPIDAFVPRKRIQPSQESNYKLCVYPSSRSAPTFGVICLFEPPGT